MLWRNTLALLKDPACQEMWQILFIYCIVHLKNCYPKPFNIYGKWTITFKWNNKWGQHVFLNIQKLLLWSLLFSIAHVYYASAYMPTREVTSGVEHISYLQPNSLVSLHEPLYLGVTGVMILVMAWHIWYAMHPVLWLVNALGLWSANGFSWLKKPGMWVK